MSERRPVGVRPAGDRWAPIRWADPGDRSLEVGDRVMVREGDQDWPADVVVASERVVEVAPTLGTLPVVAVGSADPASWPATTPGAGLALLRSLDLPPDVTDRER